MKGISSIFSSLIVTVITLSLAVPLFTYFSYMYNNNLSVINQSFNKLTNATETKLALIPVGSSTNQIYLYNYGNLNISINLIIIGKKVYKVYYTIKPSEIVPLSTIINSNYAINNSTIIIEANGNYYSFQVQLS